MDRIRVAIVGGGVIALRRHIPAMAKNPAFELVGIVDPVPRQSEVPTYPTLAALADQLAPDAVAVCTQPQVRFPLACEAVGMGKHVLVEKPPCANLAQIRELVRRAEANGVTLHAAWHSQHAQAVRPAQAWMKGRTPTRVEITWREDVRQWHPGQRWLWEAGGLGIFDPAINAISILNRLTGDEVHLTDALFETPENSETPIAAELRGVVGETAAFAAHLSFLQTGDPTWTLEIDTADGARMVIAMGGAALTLDGVAQSLPDKDEYTPIYDRFAELIRAGESEVELRPMIVAADAFLIARTRRVEPFHD